MQGGNKQQQMERLRARIAALEARPALAEGPAPARPSGGLLAAAPGLLHEVFSPDRRNGGAAVGFALAQARGLLTPQRPALLVMQLNRETREMGLPYGAGLASFGLDPQAVVLTRVETVTELLWAIEEATCCRAVAAVVADICGYHKAIDFTVSRRLGLRAANAGTSVFLLRYGSGREASAAKLRWRVAPASSGKVAFDVRAPGGPRWNVVLEKGRLGPGADGREHLVDWTGHDFVLVDGRSSEDGAGAAGRAPLSGAEPAALGNRLSETG
jgi:protein ImuA